MILEEYQKKRTAFIHRFAQEILGKKKLNHVINPESKETIPDKNSKESGWNLSIAELFFQSKNVATPISFEYLLITLIEYNQAHKNTVLFQQVNSNTLKSRIRTIESGIIIENLTISILANLPQKVSFMLYELERTSQNQQLLSRINRLFNALDFQFDPRGSISIAESILDKLPNLEVSANRLETSFFGNLSSTMIQSSKKNTQYSVFFKEEFIESSARRLWVNNSSLRVGATLGTAQPFFDQSFLMLRLGRKRNQEDTLNFIKRLRDQYAANNNNLLQNNEGESILEKEKKAQVLRKKKKIERKYNIIKTNHFPIVTPIALEVSGDMISLVTRGNNLSEAFQALINETKDFFHQEYGVKMPGIRVRGNETDLPDGTYVIMINEIPIVSGKIKNTEKLFALETMANLKELEVTADLDSHPFLETEGGWVLSSKIPVLENHKIKTLTSLEYINEHLKATLRKNITDLLIIGDIVRSLEAKNIDLLKQIQEIDSGIPKFIIILNALLKEEVSIKEIEKIGEQFVQLIERETPLYIIPDEIRNMEIIKPLLPGNTPQVKTPVFHCSDDFIQLIEKSIHIQGETAVFALVPETTQELLAAVRNEVNNHDKKEAQPVILVDNWTHRLFIRRLVELEFPNIFVLSKRELIKNPDEITFISKITLD